ncbi:MAG TPA: hypothetical protein VG253_05230 [Streptosporangiaceae bacterium]|nr:hypothetical protein [Streptosporangiaceae bacterium]
MKYLKKAPATTAVAGAGVLAVTGGGTAYGVSPPAPRHQAGRTSKASVGKKPAVRTPTMVTATTHVTNHPDSGGGGTWAYDDFGRTLTVTLDSPQPTSGVPAGDLAYTATVTDKGMFNAIVGADTPNQVTAGVKIGHAVTGSMNGGASYIVYAPVADTLTGTVETSQNDNFTASTGDHTTGDWPAQAFATPADAVVTYADAGNGWSWKYATACESWTDAGTNGAGNLAGDGNITGKRCVVPVPRLRRQREVPGAHPRAVLLQVNARRLREGRDFRSRPDRRAHLVRQRQGRCSEHRRHHRPDLQPRLHPDIHPGDGPARAPDPRYPR